MNIKINAGTIAMVLLGLTTLLIPVPGSSQQTTSGRTELQRHDLSVPGREVVQIRVDIEPGSAYPRHKHPGEEIIYVLAGSLEYSIDGQAPVILKAGDVFYIPYGVVHGVKNVGQTKAAELATYIVEKGKLLVTVVE